MAHTSATLLARLRDPADGDAWATLLGVYGPLLRTWAERLGARGADADDLAAGRLLLGRVRQEDAAGRLLLGRRLLDHHAIVQRFQGHRRLWLLSLL